MTFCSIQLRSKEPAHPVQPLWKCLAPLKMEGGNAVSRNPNDDGYSVNVAADILIDVRDAEACLHLIKLTWC